MKNYIVVFVLLLSCFTPGKSFSEKLIPHQDITYSGSFSLPTTTNANKCLQWTYILANLAYRPSGDSGRGSLYVTSGSGCDSVAEVSIPALLSSETTSYSSLNVAGILTDWTSIGGGDLTSSLPSFNSTVIGIGDISVIGPEQGVSSEQLLAVAHKGYVVGSNYPTMLEAVSTDLSTISNWYTLSLDGTTSINSAEYQHYLFTVPSSWASVNTSGKTVITGCNRQSTGGSFGATMYAFQPGWGTSPPPDGTKFTAEQLISYGNTSQMDYYQESNNPNDFTWASIGSKDVIVGSFIWGARAGRLYNEDSTHSDGAINWTQHATGWYYGNRHPTGIGSKGFHFEPYSKALIFYDPSDIVLATPATAQPYSVYDISKYCYDPNGYPGTAIDYKMGGIAYDSTGNRLFVGELIPATGRIVIHVFSLADSGTTLDSTPPTTPTNLQITSQDSTHVALSWSASTDALTNVRYLVLINGYPEIITDETSYDYTFVDEWAAGDSSTEGFPSQYNLFFEVKAIDDYFNMSTPIGLNVARKYKVKALH